MMVKSIYVPHAIIFIYDIENDDMEIPEYIDNELVSYNEGCISVGTQSEVDGEVEIALFSTINGSKVKSLIKVFDGSIVSPTKKVAVSTSEDEAILEIDIDSNKAAIDIWVDDAVFPSKMLIRAV